jgi:ADP-heptose:LPS heptosyltransferase
MPPIPDSFAPRRLLVCQQRQLGDVLLATPALECLRARFPSAAVHVLTERKCLPMLANNPHADRVWALDKATLPTLLHELRWYMDIAQQRYDLEINFQPALPLLRWVVAFSRARVRLAPSPPWYARPLYTHAVPMPRMYAAAAKAAALKPLGTGHSPNRPRLYLTQEERDEARALLHALALRPEHCLITLDPTHRQPTRRWPLAHYARMMALLAEQGAALGLDPRFLPLWGPGEEGDVRELRALAAGHGCAHRLLLPEAVLSLRLGAACMERAALHIGNCSAPRHMAVAVGTPTCVAQGSTGPEWICPPNGGRTDHVGLFAGLECQPCEKNRCPRLPPGEAYAPCMTALEPERVAREAFALLSRPMPG